MPSGYGATARRACISITGCQLLPHLLWFLPVFLRLTNGLCELRPRIGARGLFACLGLFLVTDPVRANESPPRFDYGDIAGLFDQTSLHDGLLDTGALGRAYDRYARWKSDLTARTGLSWLIEERQISQRGNADRIIDSEFNVYGRLEFARSAPARWSLMAWGQLAATLGDATGSVFQTSLGILSPLNGGNTGPRRSNQILRMLALEYVSANETFRVQIGKLALRSLMNLNRHTYGTGDSFFSPMLGSNPVVPYTELYGLGVFAQYRADNWYISGLVRAPDTELSVSTAAWTNGTREYVVEAALTPTIPGLGYGEYRLTWSLLPAGAAFSRVETLSFSADQDFGDRYGGFFRYAAGADTFRDFDRVVAAGLIMKRPLGRATDQAGIGVWQGTPTNATLGRETGVELYYRAQIAPAVHLTPNIQIVKNPANSTAPSQTVIGLRLRIAF